MHLELCSVRPSETLLELTTSLPFTCFDVRGSHTAASSNGCSPTEDDYNVNDEIVQAGSSVAWIPVVGAEYYVQVVGDEYDDYGSYTLSMYSVSSFSAEKVEGKSVPASSRET